MTENAATRPLNAAPVKRYRPRSDAALALADGTVFRGKGFGASTEAAGEAVFTTAMTGYQEVCTDPSFKGQIVCMTYPLIGNYGVTPDDDESRRPWISGLVVREVCDTPSNWRSKGTLHDYLVASNVPGIYGLDTRALTRHLRTIGDSRAVLVHDAAGLSDADLVARARKALLPGELDVVDEVSWDTIEHFGPEDGIHIVIIDCGVKRNIIRSLVKRHVRVTVVPYGTPYADIASLQPDGVIVSPGPGDPARLDSGLSVVNNLLENDLPYFGICLGHQLLARAIGAGTIKLKFGHRGGNHPVRDVRSGHVAITAQNHSYCVDGASFADNDEWNVALINLNDGSVEGLAHATRPVLSVQFHPEAAPGPLDNGYLFDQFLQMVSTRRDARMMETR